MIGQKINRVFVVQVLGTVLRDFGRFKKLLNSGTTKSEYVYFDAKQNRLFVEYDFLY